MRGRKPKPASVHELNGNPSHIDLGARAEAEPKAPDGEPHKPSFLSKAGRKAWKELAVQLAVMGTLCVTDGAALGMLAEAWATYVEAMRRVAAEGQTVDGARGMMAHPCIGVAQKQAAILMRLLPELGLTPSGRARIAIGKPKDGDDSDGIMAFISQKIEVGK